jgi:hypothetical protein
LLELGSICSCHVLSNVYFRLNFNSYKFYEEAEEINEFDKRQREHSYCYVQLGGNNRFVINIDSKQSDIEETEGDKNLKTELISPEPACATGETRTQ